MGVSYRGQVDEKALAEKLARMRSQLNERQWRRLLGAEAEAIGWGGIRLVARLSGVSVNTVSKGAKEIRDGVVDDGRVRGPGAGRPSVHRSQPGILEALDSLIAPEARGDPMSLLRWTTKSAVNLARGLTKLGYRVSATTTVALVRQLGFRLQATFKTKEGNQHPDRDAQFTYINDMARAFLKTGDPVISVDTKKKELVGEYANKGREWRPKGQPVPVNGHDFPTGVPKAIPYGVYDLGADDGFVSVGIDHDTAPFAVNAIRAWWCNVGRARYPDSTRLLITADAGGSNGYRLHAWKVELAALAAEIGRDITVVHYPTGASKWNKVEHRLFSFISINWRGRPLTDYQVIIETIAATTTDTGLTVQAVLDENTYPTGAKVTKAQLAAVPLKRHQFHGEWNYTIHKGPNAETAPIKQVRTKSTN
jgi:Rhodopirellula transposase DDE domain